MGTGRLRLDRGPGRGKSIGMECTALLTARHKAVAGEGECAGETERFQFPLLSEAMAGIRRGRRPGPWLWANGKRAGMPAWAAGALHPKRRTAWIRRRASESRRWTGPNPPAVAGTGRKACAALRPPWPHNRKRPGVQTDLREIRRKVTEWAARSNLRREMLFAAGPGAPAAGPVGAATAARFRWEET